LKLEVARRGEPEPPPNRLSLERRVVVAWPAHMLLWRGSSASRAGGSRRYSVSSSAARQREWALGHVRERLAIG